MSKRALRKGIQKQMEAVLAASSASSSSVSSASSVEQKSAPKRRLPIRRQGMKEDTFSDFFVSMLRDCKWRIKSEKRADPLAKESLQTKMAKVTAIVGKLADPELVELRKEYYKLENSVNAITTDSDKKSMLAAKEYEKLLSNLVLERDARILEIETEVVDAKYDSEGEEEAVLEASENPAVIRVREEFEHRKSELKDILDEKLLDQRREDSEKISDLKKQILELRKEKAEQIYKRIFDENAELSSAIAELYKAKLAFPGQPQQKEVSQKELDFIKSLSSIQKKEQENLTLVPAKLSQEPAEDFIEKAILRLRGAKPAMSEKQFSRMLEAQDEDRVKRRRVRQARASGEDGEDAGFEEEDVASESESEAEEEQVVAEEAEEKSLAVEFSQSQPLGYIEDSDSDSEPEEPQPDSEDEEEPVQEVKEKKPKVARVSRGGMPLSRGEKILQDIPTLLLSEKRYREVYSEINLLRRESDYVFALYRDLEENVAKPFVQLVNLDEGANLAVFQNAYNGKPFDGENVDQCFRLTDEQKMLTKHLQNNSGFIKDLKEALLEPRVTLIESDLLTAIPEEMVEDEKSWVEEHYNKYRPYLARILGKAKAVAFLKGMSPEDIPKLLSVEQDALLREHFSRLSAEQYDQFDDESAKQKDYFLQLPVREKVIAGIPVMHNLSTAIYSRFAKLKRKLNQMVLSGVEKKTDYPFTVSYEQISEYVPSLLLRVFVKHRAEILSTRPAFVRKFILSRLSVEQYIYTKVYMGESQGDFEDYLSDFIQALHEANRIEKMGLSEVEKIGNSTLRRRVVEMLDYSLSLTVGEMFKKSLPITEYQKLFRQKIPEGVFAKTEYTFLTDCRYAFRNKYALPFPVIASVDDMRVVEKVLPKILEKVDEWDRIHELLSSVSKDLTDVNIDYQEDLVKAMVENYFMQLVKEKVEPIFQFVIEKKGGEQDVSRQIAELDQLLEKRLGQSRVLPQFNQVNRYLGSEISRLVVLCEKYGFELDISDYLLEQAEEEEPKKSKSPIAQMISKLKKTRPKEVPEPDIQPLPAKPEMLTAERDPSRPVMTQSEAIRKSFEDLVANKDIESKDKKTLQYQLMEAPLRYVLSLMNEDSRKNKLKSLDDYTEEYDELQSKINRLKKKKKIADLIEKRSTSEETGVIEKEYAELASPAINYVKAKYVNMADSKEASRWEDRGVLRVHPELMRLMPRFEVDPATVPLEFCGVPLKDSKLVHPSVFFFHTLANSDVQVHPDGIVVDGRPVSLKVNGKEATAADYNELLQAIDLKSVMDAFHQSELVVIPSQVDRQMVFPIGSNALFYPGYESAAKKVRSREELQSRLDNLLVLKAKLPEQKEKIDLRIKQLQQEIAIEPRVGPLDELEKAYRVRLMAPEAELEKSLQKLFELEEEIESAQLIGEEAKEEEEQVAAEKQKMKPILDKISKIRKDYIKELQKSKLDKSLLEKRIAEVQKELEEAPMDLKALTARIEQTRERLESADEKEEAESELSGLLNIAKKWAVVRKDELEIVDSQLTELLKIKEIQKDRFVRQHEIRRLELRRQLLSGGWMRPTVALVREMNRVGRVEELKSVRVGAISYACALIKNGRLVPISGEQVLSELKKYYSDKISTRYSILQSFVPSPVVYEPSNVEAVERMDSYSRPGAYSLAAYSYQGTRTSSGDLVCANCKKSMKKVWRNTVQLIDGQPRIVPLCSEQCSEEYHPSK